MRQLHVTWGLWPTVMWGNESPNTELGYVIRDCARSKSGSPTPGPLNSPKRRTVNQGHVPWSGVRASAWSLDAVRAAVGARVTSEFQNDAQSRIHSAQLLEG